MTLKINNMDYIDDEFIKRILKDNDRPLNKMVVNDTVRKEVGDRVVIMDCSSVSHVNGDALDDEDYDKFINDDYFIVIDTGKKVKFEAISHTLYKQDLVIVNPKTNEKFRVISQHTKIFM